MGKLHKSKIKLFGKSRKIFPTSEPVQIHRNRNIVTDAVIVTVV
jgi:hypothetical protein